MPIPQLKNKRSQSWRTNKKKYYISRKSKAGRPKKRKTRYKKSGNLININITKNLKKKILITLGMLFLLGCLFGAVFLWFIARDLPETGKLIERDLAQSTKIFDRTGEQLLYEIYGEQKRTTKKLEDIPKHIIWATIAIEDKNFYKHKGISIWGILRGVVWNKVRGRRIQGGSTLTQQFVKNAILTNKRTITRKIKEWILSSQLEKKFSKDEILEFYFNEIPYGSTAYGVEAASQKYFGKGVEDINVAEAAILAALPQAPSKYSPYGPNRETLIGRQKYIIDLMFEQKYISEKEAFEAKKYKLIFKGPETNIKAPHFVMFVKEILSEKYGEKMIEQEGLKIYTTLDLYKQKIAEEIINEYAPNNEKRWGATNASLVSIDPKTGQILAMVGSRDYFNDEIDGQVNIATSKRQPGSSLKPLVYAASFIRGYTPDTILYDVVTNFTPKNVKQDPYEPHNYDSKEHGPVTMRKALAGSLNIPAVKTLYLAGVGNVIDIARRVGYTTLADPDRYGLSLVLGGGEVKLLEHTNAYSAFAREGIIHPIISILKIEDKNGNVIEEYEKISEKKVLDPKIARIINDILSDNKSRAYAFGEINWLTLGKRPIAAKTGTTNNYRDAWTIGYTPSIVTGVWVGNNDNTEMRRGAAGGVVAAPIWHDYMKKILGDTPMENFKKPIIEKTGKPILDGEAGAAVPIKIDKITGLLATEYTPQHLIEEKIFYEPHSILYFINKNDPLGDPPKKPEKDPQFEPWESRVIEWAEKQLASSTEKETLISSSAPPIKFDNLHIPENIPELKILSPTNNQIITSPLLISLIKTKAKRNLSRAEYYINDNLFYINNSYPYNMQRGIDFLNNGFHNLKIRVCDDVDNCINKEVEFNLIIENNENKKDAAISLINPGNGLAVSNIDFPLVIKLEVINPNQIAKINIYTAGEDNKTPNLLTAVEPIDNIFIIESWQKAPISGTYKIYAEAITWNNKKIKTKKVVVVVNNIEK